jgi:hypothetical protein
MKIAVYTAITAGKDLVKEAPETEGVDRILFTDAAGSSPGWDVRPACGLFVDPRRNSRAHKLLAHQYLPEYEYSMWIDGSLTLLADVRQLIDQYLVDADVAMFQHPARSCLYVEAQGCADAGSDSRDVLEGQIAAYRRAGHPLNHGLHEGGAILRRHTATTRAFNEAWWAEYCRHSCRDQVSVDYVLNTLKIKCAVLPGSTRDNNGIVYLHDHHWR